ncbi:hypothetical protein D9M68_402210 [compost metagenome]
MFRAAVQHAAAGFFNMGAHDVARAFGILFLDQPVDMAVFVDGGAGAFPGLAVDQVAHDVHRVADVVLQRFQHLHETLVAGGRRNGAVEAVIVMVGDGAGGVGFFVAGQHAVHFAQVVVGAAQGGQVGAFGLDHHAQLQAFQDVADPARRIHRGHAAHQVGLGAHIGARAADGIHQLVFTQPVQRLPNHRARHLEQRRQFQFGGQLAAGRDLARGDRVEQAFVHAFGKALGAHVAEARRHFRQHVQFRTGPVRGFQQRCQLRVTHIAHRRAPDSCKTRFVSCHDKSGGPLNR